MITLRTCYQIGIECNTKFVFGPNRTVEVRPNSLAEPNVRSITTILFWNLVEDFELKSSLIFSLLCWENNDNLCFPVWYSIRKVLLLRYHLFLMLFQTSTCCWWKLLLWLPSESPLPLVGRGVTAFLARHLPWVSFILCYFQVKSQQDQFCISFFLSYSMYVHVLLSWFYPDFIQILSWFYPDFI